MWQLHTSLHDTCNIHSMSLSHGSIIYNPQEGLLTQQVTKSLFTGKCILANYIILSFTLYFTGIRMPTKVNSTRAASN